MNNLNACPICGEKTLEYIGEFDICDICEWEDDPLQRENPEDRYGANKISLNEARAEWEARKKSSPQPLPQRAVV